MIFVTFNPSQDLLACLLMNNYDVLVVDNSLDKPLWLEEYCLKENITYIFNNDNLGIAKALNIGCQFATDKGYTSVITMDQDSTITDDIIQKLTDFANKSSQINDIAIISPLHILQNNKKVKVIDENSEFSEGISTMTSGNLLNLEIWKKLGGFRDDLFIDMVDIDYYCKAILHRYRVITLNHVYMKHMLGNLRVINILGRKVKIFNHNYSRKYYQMRNGLIVYKQYRTIVPNINLVAKFLINLLVTLPFEEGRLRKIKYIFMGFIDFLRNKTGQL